MDIMLMEANKRSQEGHRLSCSFTLVIIFIYFGITVSLGYSSDLSLLLPVSTKTSCTRRNICLSHRAVVVRDHSKKPPYLSLFSSAALWKRFKWWFKAERHSFSFSLHCISFTLFHTLFAQSICILRTALIAVIRQHKPFSVCVLFPEMVVDEPQAAPLFVVLVVRSSEKSLTRESMWNWKILLRKESSGSPEGRQNMSNKFLQDNIRQ